MSKTIYVSDFDDTLTTTGGVIRLTAGDGSKRELSPAEYAVYDKKDDDQFDFSDFDDVIDPEPIAKNVRVLRRAVESGRVDKVAILTARANPEPIARFLKMIGITRDVSIVALGDADPQKKKEYLRRQLEAGYTRMAFADDSPKNVAVARELRDEFPEAKIVVRHAHPPETEPAIRGKTRKKIDRTATVKNPVTGNDILQITAMKYPPDHPAHIAALKKRDGG
jgi:hypothetical protein